jgi:hypothetical protein
MAKPPLSTRIRAMKASAFQRTAMALGTIVLLVTLYVYEDRFIPKQSENALLLGYGAPADPVIFEPVTPISLSGLSKEKILELRVAAVNKYSQLIKGKYVPSDWVFGRIQDGAGWFGIQQFFLTGKGEGSTTGPSYLSSTVLSPFQLVIPTFWGLSIWADTNLKWKPEVVANPSVIQAIPYQPTAGAVVWNASAARAEVTWLVQKFLEESEYYLQTPLHIGNIDFGVSLVNAMDMNFKYVTLDLQNSSGVAAPRQGDPASPISEYFGYSKGTCGNKEGCNHFWNLTPPLDTITVHHLPAVATFKLWYQKPAATSDQGDFTFVVNLE